MRKHKAHILALLFGFACTAFVYRSFPQFYFLSDAWGDMHFATVNPLRFFVNDTYLSELGRNYRPLWRLSMWLQHKLSGDEWFKSSITYSFIATWFGLAFTGVFVTLWALGCKALPCLLGMLFFTLHPALVEAVAWSAAESYLLAGVFGIWAVFLTVYGFRVNRTGWYWALPVVLAACACISNETGLGIPPLLCLLWFCYDAPINFPAKPSDLKRYIFPLSLVLLLGAYFLWRILLFGAITHFSVPASPEPITYMVEKSDFFKFVAGRILWNYWPAWMEDKFSLVDRYMYFVMGVIIIGVFAWHIWRREVWACFALGILLTVAPYFTSHRVYIVNDDPVAANIDGSRVLYISLACLGVLIGCIANSFSTQASMPARRMIYTAAFFVLCQFAVNTRLNVKIWVDASKRVRQFVQTLPKCLPTPPADQPIQLQGLEPFITEQVVPGMYTNKAYTFQVGLERMVQFAYKDRSIMVEINTQNRVPGQPLVRIDKSGNAVCQ